MADRDPLNFYSPYERLPAGHENQLTRALLLLLRMSPVAHLEWLRLAAPGYLLRELPPPDFATQKRSVRTAGDEAEEGRIISVFLAPEQPQPGGGDVIESDRDQVLDAVVDYGELVVVVENKIFEADNLQARKINLKDSGLQLVGTEEIVVVLWPDLLEALSGLREHELVAGAEAALLDDFLTYVEDHFPDLGPFRSLALCDGVPTRIGRRLRQVLGEAAGSEAESSLHGPRVATPAGTTVGRDAYLTIVDDEEIQLALYPADTLSQAREFYGRSKALDGTRALAAGDGWTVTPNFHFGHMQRGFCWTTSEIEVEDYLRLWEVHIATAGNVPREEWASYWSWLIEREIAKAEDRAEFERDFTETDRQTATPRPGLMLARRWPLAKAEDLDSRDAFASAIRAALEEALVAVGESGLT